jgi:hypothetical protein
MTPLVSEKVLQLLGSFWSRIVSNNGLTKRLIQAVTFTHRQSDQLAKELTLAVASKDIPAGQVTVIQKMVFSTAAAPYVKYGFASANYGTGHFYGEVIDNKAVFTIPSNIMSIPFMYDDPVNPTKSYTENIDYVIDAGQLSFKIPFNEASVTLYGRQILKDTGFVYRQLGYVLGVNLTDRLFKKIPLAEFWRMFSFGPNYYNLMRIISLCANAPIAKHNNETVQGVLPLQEGTLVITDKETYFVPIGQVATVVVGQVLNQADSISSGIEVLHDKLPLMSQKLPAYMLSGNNFKYGFKAANPARIILIKANITGISAITLKYFTNFIPVDIKVVLLTNFDAPVANLTSMAFEPQCVLATSVRVPQTDFQITAQCNSRLKYGSYGF